MCLSKKMWGFGVLVVAAQCVTVTGCGIESPEFTSSSHAQAGLPTLDKLCPQFENTLCPPSLIAGGIDAFSGLLTPLQIPKKSCGPSGSTGLKPIQPQTVDCVSEGPLKDILDDLLAIVTQGGRRGDISAPTPMPTVTIPAVLPTRLPDPARDPAVVEILNGKGVNDSTAAAPVLTLLFNKALDQASRTATATATPSPSAVRPLVIIADDDLRDAGRTEYALSNVNVDVTQIVGIGPTEIAGRAADIIGNSPRRPKLIIVDGLRGGWPAVADVAGDNPVIVTSADSRANEVAGYIRTHPNAGSLEFVERGDPYVLLDAVKRMLNIP